MLWAGSGTRGGPTLGPGALVPGWASAGLGVRARGAVARAAATNGAFFMAAFLPGKGAKVQHRFRESPLRFDKKPLDAAGMSKDKSAKIPTPKPVRGPQDMPGDFPDRSAPVVEPFAPDIG